MKELKSIITEYKKASAAGQRAVFATLIRLTGSGYRRPGAHMLVIDDGRHIGTVIGACLQRDLVEHCLQLLASNSNARLIEYDTSHNDDEILGSGSGCTGSLQILIESLDSKERNNPILILEELILRANSEEEIPYALVTCIERSASRQNSEHLQISRRIIHQYTQGEKQIKLAAESDGSAQQSLDLQLIMDAGKVIQQQKAQTFFYKADDIECDRFIEPILPNKRLLVFGAGNDSESLVDMASLQGYQIEVYDHRKGFVTPSRFPQAKIVQQLRVESDIQNSANSFPKINHNCYCVLMSHNFLVDKQVLCHLLQSKAAYIGILGPQKRSQRMFEQLRQEGINIDPENNERLYAPIGLDIGAELPEQIALSILSEIQALCQKREAGFLRNSKRPIHEPIQEAIDELMQNPSLSTEDKQAIPGLPGASNANGFKKRIQAQEIAEELPKKKLPLSEPSCQA